MTELDPNMDNPLRKYFREPGIHIKLPTQGFFYPKGMIHATVTDEIPVYPMTTYDELIFKNPDALLNGDALEKVISSCVPAITNPRMLCVNDVDAILLAIRASTYGDTLTITSDCPKCETENEGTTSIRYVLESGEFLEDSYTIKMNENVTLHIRPRSMEADVKSSLIAFEHAKMAQQIEEAETLDDIAKNKHFRESFERTVMMNFDLIASSIFKIVIPEGEITNEEHIREFMNNIDTTTSGQIVKLVNDISDIGITKTHNMTCSKCGNEWITVLNFDPTHFFA